MDAFVGQVAVNVIALVIGAPLPRHAVRAAARSLQGAHVFGQAVPVPGDLPAGPADRTVGRRLRVVPGDHIAIGPVDAFPTALRRQVGFDERGRGARSLRDDYAAQF